jgi:hypothetical protein
MTSERNFLHDLIGPLSTAANLTEILIEELTNKCLEKKDLVLKLQKILTSMDAASGLVAGRREHLVQLDSGENR